MGAREAMKRTLAIISILVMLAGCGSNSQTPEETAQEKRNNFDACLIQWFVENTTNTKSSTEYYRPNAESACVYLLK